MSKSYTGDAQTLIIVESEPDLFLELEGPMKEAGHRIFSFPNSRLLVPSMDDVSQHCGAAILINCDKVLEKPSEIVRKVKFHTHIMEVILVGTQFDHEDVILAFRELADDCFTRPETSKLMDYLLKRLYDLPFNGILHNQKYSDRFNPLKTLLDSVDEHLRQKITEISGVKGLPALLDVEFSGRIEVLQTKKATVMLVDDDTVLRTTLEDNLRKTYVILTADSADAALGLLREHRVDVILLDIHMPGLSGDKAIAEIKKIDPDVEIIILTGFEETDIASTTFRNGACDYLNKPAKKELLIAKIEGALTVKHNRTNTTGKLPFERRMTLFKKYVEAADKRNKLFSYDDFFQFFPEAKQCGKKAITGIAPAQVVEDCEGWVATAIQTSKQRERDMAKKMQEAMLAGEDWEAVIKGFYDE